MNQTPAQVKKQKLRESSEPLPIRIRKATENDIPFIFSSWLRSYRQSPAVRNITNTIYFTEHHKVLERLLKSCDVNIACAENDPADIYGFSCGETVQGIFVMHYVYVKHVYRQLGIGTQLLAAHERNPDSAAMYTHHTLASSDLAKKYCFVYSPYIALIPEYRSAAPIAKEEA